MSGENGGSWRNEYWSRNLLWLAEGYQPSFYLTSAIQRLSFSWVFRDHIRKWPGTISRFSQVWIEMDKGQVAVQREEIDKAFTYQREQELKEKSFYPLPYSKSSLVLLWTGLFERTGTHFVLCQKCCVLLWIKLQTSVYGRCMKMLLLKKRYYNWHV